MKGVVNRLHPLLGVVVREQLDPDMIVIRTASLITLQVAPVALVELLHGSNAALETRRCLSLEVCRDVLPRR